SLSVVTAPLLEEMLRLEYGENEQHGQLLVLVLPPDHRQSILLAPEAQFLRDMPLGKRRFRTVTDELGRPPDRFHLLDDRPKGPRELLFDRPHRLVGQVASVEIARRLPVLRVPVTGCLGQQFLENGYGVLAHRPLLALTAAHGCPPGKLWGYI